MVIITNDLYTFNLDKIKYHMKNRYISDGLVKNENLLIGEEDETKVDAEDKLLSNSAAHTETKKQALSPAAAQHVAN